MSILRLNELSFPSPRSFPGIKDYLNKKQQKLKTTSTHQHQESKTARSSTVDLTEESKIDIST